MWHITKILRAKSFTFGSYKIDKKLSIVTFTYYVEFKSGFIKTFNDHFS